VGLIGVLVKEFRPIFIIIPLYAIVYLAFMGCKLVRNSSCLHDAQCQPHRSHVIIVQALLFGGGKSANSIWEVQVFVFLSVLQKLGQSTKLRVMVSLHHSCSRDLQLQLRWSTICSCSIPSQESEKCSGTRRDHGSHDTQLASTYFTLVEATPEDMKAMQLLS
jgi:hypothetical protein